MADFRNWDTLTTRVTPPPAEAQQHADSAPRPDFASLTTLVTQSEVEAPSAVTRPVTEAVDVIESRYARVAAETLGSVKNGATLATEALQPVTDGADEIAEAAGPANQHLFVVARHIRSSGNTQAVTPPVVLESVTALFGFTHQYGDFARTVPETLRDAAVPVAKLGGGLAQVAEDGQRASQEMATIAPHEEPTTANAQHIAAHRGPIAQNVDTAQFGAGMAAAVKTSLQKNDVEWQLPNGASLADNVTTLHHTLLKLGHEPVTSAQLAQDLANVEQSIARANTGAAAMGAEASRLAGEIAQIGKIVEELNASPLIASQSE